MTAVIGPEDGVRSYSEIIETTRDDKGVWFIEGRKNKFNNRKARYNRLRVKIRSLSRIKGRWHGARRWMDVDTCIFRVDSSLSNAFEAMGYAVATDRLWQMELYRRTARGRLAEILGPAQLQSDVFMRTIGYTEDELASGFADLDDESKAVIAGYVAGINRRISEIRDTPLLPYEFVTVGFSPEDWTVEDILAWCALLQREFDPEALDTAQLDSAALLDHLVGFAAVKQTGGDLTVAQKTAMEMFQDLRWPNDPEAQTYIVDMMAATDEAGEMDGTLRRVPGLRDACDKLKDRRDKVRDNLKKINAKVKMGSYAWVVSGKKTASGNPIIYSGPQMGFSVPSIVCEGSIRAAGLNISGMTVPGIPGIIIGRTPHHAWSMQVGHAHTTDYYIEDLNKIISQRQETIAVRGAENETIDVYRTAKGPVINADPVISWRYSHWGYEFNVVKAFLGLAEAQSIKQFGESIEEIAVSQHFCYADRDGNIAYWMSGRDPVRPMETYLGPYLYFLPQGALGEELVQDWDDNVLVPRSHARNPKRGFFAGWNNKTNPSYFNAFNSTNDIYGPFQRSHVIYKYLATHNDLTFEDIRDLALNIATTDSFNGGGNPWVFVKNAFTDIVDDWDIAEYGALTERHKMALDTLKAWDGHFVKGNWVDGAYRAQGWVLMNDWLREVIRLTFADELYDEADKKYLSWNNTLLFNVILHAMDEDGDGLKTTYDWFSNLGDKGAPQTLEEIVIAALDTVMDTYGDDIPRTEPRGEIVYTHDLLGPVCKPTPYSSRSTYAHVVEFGCRGPIRIESMFPLGESGNISIDSKLDANFCSMEDIFNAFAPRDFPLFTEMRHGKKR